MGFFSGNSVKLREKSTFQENISKFLNPTDSEFLFYGTKSCRATHKQCNNIKIERNKKNEILTLNLLLAIIFDILPKSVM